MKRSKFSLSHYKLLTSDMGYIVPLTWYETLPGDTIQQATSALIRVSPLLSPVMHPVRVRIHHWFVPYRLIWDEFEDFITGGPDGTSTPVHPYISLTNPAEGALSDYLGVPPGTYSIDVNALPFRAYNLIYNEHYRDQDLVTELTIDDSSGQDTTSNTSLVKAAWEKDYFTTCRPWEQKGTQVTIPLGDSAPVAVDVGLASEYGVYSSVTGDYRMQAAGGARVLLDSNTATAGTSMYADLSNAAGIDINDLRLALSIQRYQEARARYGSRYTEYLRYLGVRPSDGRLQAPEYLGGGRQVIQFSEVLQTAEGTDPVGDLKGHGIGAMRTNRYRRFFDEHGLVMTLMSVVPKAIYSQALSRSFHRSVKEDYFQRELQFIGEQEITNKEVYALHSSPDDVFGYQSRYDEYRYLPSSIAGEFHSTLNHWHYARIHAGDIALNQSFTDCTPTKRVNASTGTDCLYIMSNHSIQARRMLTKRATSKTF